MTESWKIKVSNVSDRIFPGIAYYGSYRDSDFAHLGHEITSNLPLQMALFFNVIFFPFWLATTITMLYLKYDCLTSIYHFIIILIIVCLLVVECVRLYLGYLGNLSEKVPELAGFWLVSTVLQLPLHFFLLLSLPMWPLPAEYAVEAVMLVLLATELCSGFVALKKSARHQARRFHLLQLQRERARSVRTIPFTEDNIRDAGAAGDPSISTRVTSPRLTSSQKSD